MSTITIQIGQCGNQIGECLYDTIINDCYSSTSNCSSLKRTKSLTHLNELSTSQSKVLNDNYIVESTERFFTQTESSASLFARSILIDMESKVVNKLINTKNAKQWTYRDTNAYTQKKGSGNNWSYGYCINGPCSNKLVTEKLRHEVERCDRLSNFLIIMSMAGGTGSGVGSYYTELLNDLYERVVICNTCIWPFQSGEVTLQNYNFVLTLNKLYESSNAIILLENDTLHQVCKRFNASNNNKTNEITFNDLNQVAGHMIASVIQPCNFNSSNYLNEILGYLCANDDYKLLALNSVPQMSKESIEFSTHSWSQLYRQIKQQTIALGKSLGACLYARGDYLSVNEHLSLIQSSFDRNFMDKHFSTALYGKLMNPIKLYETKRSFNNYDKCLSSLSNSQETAIKIDSLVDKAWNMFTSKAFLHHYLKYDRFDEQLMLNSFVMAEQLIKNYKNI